MSESSSDNQMSFGIQMPLKSREGFSMPTIIASLSKLRYPQAGFTGNSQHDKMDPIMPMENQSSPLPELPGPVPKNTEAPFEVPQVAERKENHTLTVRETARMFEAAGVARTERSVINWCQPNRQGITRLDSYYDPNERKYYITPQSVEAVIQEEIQRSNKTSEPVGSEPFGSPVARVKHPINSATPADGRKLQELEREILDLKITNRGKDYLIDQLKSERTGFFEKLLSATRTVGQLETELQHLDAPKSDD